MRSTEINAVLGIEQMKRLDSNIEKRVKNLKIWLDNLDSLKYIIGFNLQGNSSFALPLIFQFSHSSKLKDVCKLLEQEKVEYRLGTAGGGNQASQPYLEKFEYRISRSLPTINYVHSNSLYIGNHTDLTDEQIINLCKKLNNV
jgi:CDP-6-deoxy-D-xylo-4-hexulose-3-dehydrase